MERRRAGRFVEEQVAAERFVGALAGQDHLDAQRFDVARQDVHWHRRPHLRAAARVLSSQALDQQPTPLRKQGRDTSTI